MRATLAPVKARRAVQPVVPCTAIRRKGRGGEQPAPYCRDRCAFVRKLDRDERVRDGDVEFACEMIATGPGAARDRCAAVARLIAEAGARPP